jgi:hypothetical protein
MLTAARNLRNLRLTSVLLKTVVKVQGSHRITDSHGMVTIFRPEC